VVPISKLVLWRSSRDGLYAKSVAKKWRLFLLNLYSWISLMMEQMRNIPTLIIPMRITIISKPTLDLGKKIKPFSYEGFLYQFV